VEKTLVEIPWRSGNFNGINEISGRRRKVAFSWRWPTNFEKIGTARRRFLFFCHLYGVVRWKEASSKKGRDGLFARAAGEPGGAKRGSPS
jgi:hypothetical protein